MGIENTVENKKKQSLRNNEYYQTQELYDSLYEKSKRGFHFHNLVELITERENILLAYRNIKSNRGSNTPGVNNTVIDDLAKWTQEKMIRYVRERLKYYEPMPVRREYIPKPDGRQRPLGIPTIEDRLIQQCIKQILEPICEAKFYKHSYGFRPNRSTKHAIARCNHLMNHNGLYYVVDVDIKGFFDNVDQGKLKKQIWTLGIRDKNFLSILGRLLKARIVGEGVPEKGTPQGGTVSPLLANIVLNELDWWIASQWETFKTDHQYSQKSGKFRALKGTDLKEIYIVRYADDFKIFCRDYETASKIKIATKEWLKQRLNLEVSERKTSITNLKANYSKFLGIKFKVIKKGGKYVAKSRLTKQSQDKIVKKLKEQIKVIRRNAVPKQVKKLNSMILNYHNYYSMATHVNIDFHKIAFLVNRTLFNRLKGVMSEKGGKSRTYQKYYGGYNYKSYYVARIRIFPIAGVITDTPLNFNQKICDYTEKGRMIIHKRLMNVSPFILNYLVKNPVKGASVEYNDNRTARYIAQNGCGYVTGLPLEIGEMEAHHKKPRKVGGSDNYRNLVLVTADTHKLIHATDEFTIRRYIRKIGKGSLDKAALSKLNKLRSKLENNSIEVD